MNENDFDIMNEQEGELVGTIGVENDGENILFENQFKIASANMQMPDFAGIRAEVD